MPESCGVSRDGVEVSLLTRTGPIKHLLASTWAGGDGDLFAFSRVSPVLPLEEPVDVETPGNPWAVGVVSAIGSTWLLMQQATVAQPRPVDVERAIRAEYRAASRPQPVVTLVDLRRAAASDRGGHEPASREYRHRWMVRGHWRQQAYGPARSLRRPTWIPPHVKGPDGAPLIEAETVMVWRR